MSVFPLRLGWLIFSRDYKIRFRRTFLGLFWYLVPIFMLTAAAVLIGGDLGFYSEGEANLYIVKLIAGLMAWQLVSESWLEALRFGRRLRSVSRSVPFNHLAILWAGAVSSLLGFFIKLPILMALCFFLDTPLSPVIYLLPLGLLAALSAGIALAGFSVPLSLNFLEVRYGVPILQTALLVTTPIFYPQPESGIISRINDINPFTHLILPIRDCLISTTISFWSLIIGLIASLTLLGLSLLYFKKKIRLAIAYIGR